MKIIIYCQHVLGIGHLFRTLQIAREMKEHRVILVLGGPPASFSLPDHVQVVQLPGLQMDPEFSELSPVDPTRSLESVKAERAEILYSLVQEQQPDVFMIELFPFGRNGFSFELLPVLTAIRSGELPPSRVICSLRDILVEKKNQAKFEQRVLDRINSLFDALLVHSDPKLVTLDQTFSRMQEITVPVVYTGYICEKSAPGQGASLKDQMRLQPDEKLIVVSAGGGNVGCHLLETALRSYHLLDFPVHMQIFTGPYLADDDVIRLKSQAVPGVRIEKFADNFPAWLAAADLSISMGGYNTTMNVLAAGTPALILPFSQNREQRMRCERIAAVCRNISVLDENQLSPSSMAERIRALLDKKKQVCDILLDGAEQTNKWLTDGVNSEQ